MNTMWKTDCDHDLAECETMCADGFCPMCMSARIKELEARLTQDPEDARCQLFKQTQQYQAEAEKQRQALQLREIDKKDLEIGQCYVYVDDNGEWQFNEYASDVGIASGKRRRFLLPPGGLV